MTPFHSSKDRCPDDGRSVGHMVGADSSSSPISDAHLASLVELVKWRGLHQHDREAFIFLRHGETEESRISYGRLDRRAKAIASHLQSLGAVGDRALLLFPTGIDYVCAFLGCIYSGSIAVPLYNPPLNRRLDRIQSVIDNSRATLALTTSPIYSKIQRVFAETPALNSLDWLVTDEISDTLAEQWEQPRLNSNTPAFLQYTSGSTGDPKGVIVSHGNLLHNQSLIQLAFRQSDKSIIVSWLPLYHDMGLVGNVIQTLFSGATCILMSPEAFLQRPFRWLNAISRYRATTSGGPNFSYELCVTKISLEERHMLDLSSWEVAFNGSEAIRSDTLDRFEEKFVQCGFRRQAFYPCYGLAEGTLIAAAKSHESLPVVKTVALKSLEPGSKLENSGFAEGSKRLVSSGNNLPGQRLVIVDPESLTECGRGEVGEIWLSGPSVSRGYWNRPQDADDSFGAYLSDTDEGPFLRTGDLGFLDDGELFVTGRRKDLIIIRGINYYPQDIEHTVEQSHAGLRPGCCAAFSVEVADEERLVVIQEAKRGQKKLDDIIDSIRQAVSEQHNIQVYAVTLLQPGSIPKTSSGKMRRQACRSAFLNDSLKAVAEWRAHILPQADRPVSTEGAEGAEGFTGWLTSRLASMLGVEASSIDLNRSIILYGIDSLSAIELSHGTEANFGLKLPVSVFLQGYSVNELTAIASSLSPNPEKDLGPGKQAPIAEFPLSYGQRGMWFLNQLNPDSSIHNIVRAVRIQSALNAPALRRAFQAMVDRHRCLRSTFPTAEGEPVQRIGERAQVYFCQEDASAFSEEQLEARLSYEARRPFRLADGPLMRVHLFSQTSHDHILLLSLHHIIVDFWSLAVLVQELGVAYEAEARGEQALFPPLEVEYSDYVRRQSEMLSSDKGERLRSYWLGRLSSETTMVFLKTDRPRPPVQTHRGATRDFKLNRDLTSQLKKHSQDRGATLYMILLAAFQVLLHRYTFQDSIAIGSPTAGRAMKGTDRVVGYFVNPVVMLADFSEKLSFDQFLNQTRQTVLSALEHQEYPFTQLVDDLQYTRDASRSPIFQVMFVFQKSQVSNAEDLASFALGDADARIELGPLTLRSMSLDRRVSQFDLTLTMAEVKDTIAASIEYSVDLFDGETIGRMGRHLETLLQGIIADPNQHVSRLPLLTDAERSQLVLERNASGPEYSEDFCIHELFVKQVERTPDAIAIEFEQQQVTYLDLHRRTNKLARYLQARGARPEAIVAICLSCSTEVIVGILAVLKTGAAYLPLDPDYPKDRLATMLHDSEAQILLTEKRFWRHLPDHKAETICIDAEWEAISTERDDDIRFVALPRNPAYVIYTSGSTGGPKGVVITHANVARLFKATDTYFHFDDRDIWTLFHSYAFDFSVWELWGALLYGGRGILVPYWIRRSPELFYELLATQAVTVLNQTPSAFRHLIQAEQSLGETKGLALRLVIFGGEALDLQNLNPWFNWHDDCRPVMANMYGITETTVHVTCHQISRANLRNAPGSVIGGPITDLRVYLFDEHLELTPVGIPGEIGVSGAGLARGYWRLPALTAERFIPNPFGERAGSRLYRSGDLARLLHDNDLQYLGRIDNQVKVRGFRIELGEVESILSRHSAIRESVVLAHDDLAGEKRLVAYMTIKQGMSVTVGELRAFMKAKLPDYMVPSAYIVLENFPTTQNGKLDRRALPAPDKSALRYEGEFQEPRTVVEKELAGIWGDVLAVEAGNIFENFFEMGGNSLLASQLISRVRKTFQIEVPLHSIFTEPTIAQFSRVIEQHIREGGRPRRQALARVAREQYASDIPVTEKS